MKNIGIKVTPPDAGKATVKDRNSPFTGEVKVRGRTFTGTVLSTKMTRTATVSWARTQYDRKYERYIKKWTKVHAHNPDIINAQKGDVVRIAETRPISKTKHFVIVEVVGKDIESQIKEESRELDQKAKTAHEEARRRRKEGAKQQASSAKKGADTIETPAPGQASSDDGRDGEEPDAAQDGSTEDTTEG